MAALQAPQAQARRRPGRSGRSNSSCRSVPAPASISARGCFAGSADGAGKSGGDRGSSRGRRAGGVQAFSPPTTIIRCWRRPADRSPCIRSIRSCRIRRPTLYRSRGSQYHPRRQRAESMKISTLASSSRARAERKIQCRRCSGYHRIHIRLFREDSRPEPAEVPYQDIVRPPPTWAKAAFRSTWRRTRSCNRRPRRSHQDIGGERPSTRRSCRIFRPPSRRVSRHGGRRPGRAVRST